MDWFVIWGSSLSTHWKWIGLSMAERGAWITLLSLAHGFEPRWEFRDRRHVCLLLQRERADDADGLYDALVGARLLDETEDGRVVVHDHKRWQPVPSDLPEARRERKQRSRDGVTRSHADVTPSHEKSRADEREETQETEEPNGNNESRPNGATSLLDALLKGGLNPDLASAWDKSKGGSG